MQVVLEECVRTKEKVMRIQIAYLNSSSNFNLASFLQYGKIGDTRSYDGHYEIHGETTINDLEHIKDIAATILLRKDEIILFHWHVLKGKKVEDMYRFKRDPLAGYKCPLVLFKELLATRPESKSRKVFKVTLKV